MQWENEGLTVTFIINMFFGVAVLYTFKTGNWFNGYGIIATGILVGYFLSRPVD